MKAHVIPADDVHEVRADVAPIQREHEQTARLLARRYAASPTVEERVHLAELLDAESRTGAGHALDLLLRRYPAVAEVFEQRRFEAAMGGRL